MLRRIQVISVLVLTVSVAFVAGWHSRPVIDVKPVTVRGSGTYHELFIVTSDFPEGEWYPIVKSTTRRLKEVIPIPKITYVVACINEDGTVCLTSHYEAERRGDDQELRNIVGWPHGNVARNK